VRFSDGRISWYTFAGERINLALGETFERQNLPVERIDDYAIHFTAGLDRERFETFLDGLDSKEVINSLGSNKEAEEALKFSDCVPLGLLTAEIVARRCLPSELEAVLKESRVHQYLRDLAAVG